MYHLILENVFFIKKAKIALNSLTVIADENDTGKSTVGKLMFTIVKTLSCLGQDLNEERNKSGKL